MLFQNPLHGVIAPDKRFYAGHHDASGRTEPRKPLVTLDFGPTTVKEEPPFDWKGGESNIFGASIPADTYGHFHKAIDISTGGCSDPVLAAAKGVLTTSEKNERGCEVIVLEHDRVGGHRFETRYVHLSERFARTLGKTVEQGAVIGTLGKSGTKACHLHFAVRKDGKWVDPWRRLAQHVSVDPDLPSPLVLEATDVPVPASDNEYLAGSVAFVGNDTMGAKVRDEPDTDGTVLRTVPGGTTEEWLPTCWVKGEVQFDSDRWLTRWNAGRWEYTHSVNVGSVTPL